MTLHVTIELDNAAFEDGALMPAIGSILKTLANRLPLFRTRDTLRSGDSLRLFDYNGNSVGQAVFIDESEADGS